MKTLHNVLSSFALSLLLYLPSWFLLYIDFVHCFLFLSAANRRLRSALNSTKHIRCSEPAVLSYPSSIVKKQASSPASAHDTWVPECARECKLTFLSMTDTGRTMHVHCENRSLIQSLVLMRSAITVPWPVPSHAHFCWNFWKQIPAWPHTLPLASRNNKRVEVLYVLEFYDLWRRREHFWPYPQAPG